MRIERIGRDGGFTLIELLTTIVVLGVLAGIAMPTFKDAVARAEARKVLTDVAAVRTAVLEYREDSGELPRSAPWGRVPPELTPYLGGVAFQYRNVTYRVTSNAVRGRVDLRVRYERNEPVAGALRVFDRPGSHSGSATWNRTLMRFRLLENHR